jgi:uncharacterized protein YkwD
VPFTMPLFRLLAVLTGAAVLALAAVAAAPAPAAASAKACKHAKNWQSVQRATSAMRCLVNAERRKRGLRPLRANARLDRVARAHSRDMVRYRFIGHRSPARGTLKRRVMRSKFTRSRAFTFGEILGEGRRGGARPDVIMREWMKRPIHSTAILHRNFKYMGVGVVKGTATRGKRGGGRNYVITFGG